MNVALVTIPALLGAAGTVVSTYIGVKIRKVEQQTNGKIKELEASLSDAYSRIGLLQRDQAGSIKPAKSEKSGRIRRT